MSEVAAADKKLVQKPFANEIVVKRCVYDVAVDGGAETDTFTVAEMDDDMVLLDAYTNITTAFTSGGSATAIIGVTGDTDAILASTAVASMTAGIKPGAAACEGILLAAGDKVLVTVGTAAMTAGKLEVVLLLVAR